MNPFKLGDTVTLASGSLSMTVTGRDGTGPYIVEVSWTNDFGELEQHWLPVECVREVGVSVG